MSMENRLVERYQKHSPSSGNGPDILIPDLDPMPVAYGKEITPEEQRSFIKDGMFDVATIIERYAIAVDSSKIPVKIKQNEIPQVLSKVSVMDENLLPDQIETEEDLETAAEVAAAKAIAVSHAIPDPNESGKYTKFAEKLLDGATKIFGAKNTKRTLTYATTAGVLVACGTTSVQTPVSATEIPPTVAVTPFIATENVPTPTPEKPRATQFAPSESDKQNINTQLTEIGVQNPDSLTSLQAGPDVYLFDTTVIPNRAFRYTNGQVSEMIGYIIKDNPSDPNSNETAVFLQPGALAPDSPMLVNSIPVGTTPILSYGIKPVSLDNEGNIRILSNGVEYLIEQQSSFYDYFKETSFKVSREVEKIDISNPENFRQISWEELTSPQYLAGLERKLKAGELPKISPEAVTLKTDFINLKYDDTEQSKMLQHYGVEHIFSLSNEAQLFQQEQRPYVLVDAVKTELFGVKLLVGVNLWETPGGYLFTAHFVPDTNATREALNGYFGTGGYDGEYPTGGFFIKQSAEGDGVLRALKGWEATGDHQAFSDYYYAHPEIFLPNSVYQAMLNEGDRSSVVNKGILPISPAYSNPIG